MNFSFLTKNIGQRDFVLRAVAVTAVFLAMLAAAIIMWKLSDLIPTVFATILIAIAWRSAAERVAARLGLSPGLSLAIVALGLFASTIVALWAFGGQLIRQYDEVALDVPAAVALIEKLIEEHPWGHFIEKFVVNVDFSKVTTPVASQLGAIVSLIGNGLAYGVFAIIGAAYLAADPQGHVSGAVALAPPARRDGLSRFLDRSNQALRQWLLIQLYVVVMNGAFAGVALWAFGVPAPLALLTISGALAFIPYFGSIVAIIVGVLVALPHGLETAALAALAIGGASFIEGYLITPYLQSRSLSVPPVVLLFCMLGFGALFGVMGVVLAVPATVILAVAYNMATESRAIQ